MSKQIARDRTQTYTRCVAVFVMSMHLIGCDLNGDAELPEVDLSGAETAVMNAVEQARSAVLDSSGSAEAWGRFGMVLLAHNFFAPAEECFKQAEQLNSDNAQWPYLRARSLLKGEPQPDEAIVCLQRAAGIARNNFICRLVLAETLLTHGRVDEAEGQFRKVLDTEPSNRRAQQGMARILLSQGQIDEALVHLESLISHAQDTKAVHSLLAEVHFRLQDEGKVRHHQELASRLPADAGWQDPYMQEVRKLRVGVMPDIEHSAALFASGRPDEAFQLLERTIKRHPEALMAHLALGRFLRQARRVTQAEAALLRAVKLKPKAFEAHHELGLVLMQMHRNDDAARAFNQALEIKPSYAPSHFQLGECQLELRHRDLAMDAFRQAVRYRPSFAAAHKRVGQLLAHDLQPVEALAHLQLALKLEPNDAEVKALLESVQLELNQER